MTRVVQRRPRVEHPVTADLQHQEGDNITRNDGAVVAEHPESGQPPRMHQHHGRVVQSAEFNGPGCAQAPRVPPVPNELDESLQCHEGQQSYRSVHRGGSIISGPCSRRDRNKQASSNARPAAWTVRYEKSGIGLR